MQNVVSFSKGHKRIVFNIYLCKAQEGLMELVVCVLDVKQRRLDSNR